MTISPDSSAPKITLLLFFHRQQGKNLRRIACRPLQKFGKAPVFAEDIFHVRGGNEKTFEAGVVTVAGKIYRQGRRETVHQGDHMIDGHTSLPDAVSFL